MSDSIFRVAERLQEELSGNPWFVAVGVGQEPDGPALYVYVTSYRDSLHLRPEWGGYPLMLKRAGKPRPLGQSNTRESGTIEPNTNTLGETFH